MELSCGEITQLLIQLRAGDSDARAKLVPLVYRRLHQLAAGYMRRERQNHTLQPTALVNEAYLRMISQEQTSWQDRAHFFGVAARLMRQILVDYARVRQAEKRGGREDDLPLEEARAFSPALSPAKSQELLQLDEALSSLEQFDPELARVVDLRFFGGLTVEETAEVLGISPRTVKREWNVARAWLHGKLTGRVVEKNGK